MTAADLRESPIPVLLVLAAVLGSVEYLHWAVISREENPVVVQVPAAPVPREGTATEDDGAPGEMAEIEAVTAGRSEASGPLHEESRRLASEGDVAGALRRLDDSLVSEDHRDAVRLQERGVLLLKLARPADAVSDLKEARRRGAASAALFYNLGLALARTGDLSRAEAAYRKAVDIRPGFDEAWNNLAVVLERRGSRQESIEALERAVSLAQPSQRHRPLTNLSRLLVRSGKRREAVALLEEAIRLSPSEAGPRLALAAIETENPRGAVRARELYEQIIRVAPADPSGHYHLGELETRLGNLPAAERQYLLALEVQPAHRRARYALAMLLLDAGRAAEAAEHLQVLTQQAPEARYAFALGRARRAQGDVARAEMAYRDAVRLAGGRYPEALHNLGVLLAEESRPKDAESAYREALRQDPTYAASWINLALLLDEMNRSPEALEAADHAVAASPGNEKGWFVRGRLLAEAGRRDEALAAYREAVKLRPDYTKATLNAAVLHADAGREDEAIRLYREVLAIDPRNGVAWYNLGLALHRLNRDAEARVAYEEALRADPESTRAAKNLGVLYAREGRIEDARRVLADALERTPRDTGLRYNLALQLEKLGRRTQAIRELERVVSLEPDRPRAWRVLARLYEAEGLARQAELAVRKAEELGTKRGPSTEETEQ